MSKKLLMNNRNGNSLLPTQDGLVCWLDAFDLTTYEVGTVWQDRTSNNNNGVVQSISGFESVANGILHAKSLVNIPNPTKGLSDYTVEVGYEDVVLSYWCGLWGNTSDAYTNDPSGNFPDGISFYQADNKISCYPVNMTPPDKEGLSGGKNYIVFTFTSTGFTIYINGQKNTNFLYNDTRRINPSNANYLCFMGRKPNAVTVDANTGADMIKNKWYFLRVYNRALTQEEIEFNYNYELSLTRGE